jgi:hypothetical protein
MPQAGQAAVTGIGCVSTQPHLGHLEKKWLFILVSPSQPPMKTAF